MSHFIGLCFGDNWENDLDQYYEGLEVDEYIAHTKSEAIEIARKSKQTMFEIATKKIQEDSLPKEDYEYYNKLVYEGCSLSEKAAWEEVQKWGYKMDEHGNLLSTYNPCSKWDWYSIGGRWSGFLPLKERDSEGNPLKTNEAYFHEVDWEYLLTHQCTPFCFVTEDGEWFDKGEMGWWGIAHNEKPEDDWDKQFKDYLNNVDSDCLVTVIDFHI